MERWCSVNRTIGACGKAEYDEVVILVDRFSIVASPRAAHPEEAARGCYKRRRDASDCSNRAIRDDTAGSIRNGRAVRRRT